jgi:chemotaxis protein CheC
MIASSSMLSPEELDVVQEIASIGCGQALTALGKLMNRRIEMDVPEAWVGADEGAIADFLGAMGQELVAVSVRLEGLLSGHLVLSLPNRDAAELAAVLGFPVSGTDWPVLAESAVMESGNIVGSAFVSAVAAMIDQKLLLSVPKLARGAGKACLDALVEPAASTVALATRFTCSPPRALEGLILVMPDPSRLAMLLAAVRARTSRRAR